MVEGARVGAAAGAAAPRIRCACEDDAARETFEKMHGGQTPLAGGASACAPVEELKRLFIDMAESAVRNGNNPASRLAAARTFGPRIQRAAVAAGLISESQARELRPHSTTATATDTDNAHWAPLLLHIESCIQSALPVGVQRAPASKAPFGFDVYLHVDARFDTLARVTMVAAGGCVRESPVGTTLTDLLRANAATHNEEGTEHALTMASTLIRWVRTHLPPHPALNTSNVLIGDRCVSIVGWDAARANRLDCHSESDDVTQDPVAAAARRLNELLA